MAAGSPGGFPRPLLYLVIGVAALGVTAIFVHRGFPYDRVRDSVAAEIAARSGARVTIETLEPRMTATGPALEAGGIRARLRSGETIEIDSALVRPAWIAAWLRGDPGVGLRIEGDGGFADTAFTRGGRAQGEFRDVPLARLPADFVWPGAALDGRADGAFEFEAGATGPVGAFEIRARDGSLHTPEIGFGVPFDTLDASVRIAESGEITIDSFDLRGPLIAAVASGTAGSTDNFLRAELDIRIDVTAPDRTVRRMLEAQGVALDRRGSGSVRITGTPSRPRFDSSGSNAR